MNTHEDTRYSITIEHASRLKHTKYVRFCGEYIGKAETMKGANKIIEHHLRTRTQEQAEFAGY